MNGFLFILGSILVISIRPLDLTGKSVNLEAKSSLLILHMPNGYLSISVP